MSVNNESNIERINGDFSLNNERQEDHDFDGLPRRVSSATSRVFSPSTTPPSTPRFSIQEEYSGDGRSEEFESSSAGPSLQKSSNETPSSSSLENLVSVEITQKKETTQTNTKGTYKMVRLPGGREVRVYDKIE